MDFLFESTSLKKATFDKMDINKIQYNGTTVWTAADEHPYYFTLTSDGAAYEISLNDSARYTFTSSTLTLPTTYNGKPIRGIADYGFSEEEDAEGDCWTSFINTVKTLIIPDAANCYTYIGKEAFFSSHLTRVEIQSTRMAEIGVQAFCGASLTSINLDAITASLTVENSAFENCFGLKAISFPSNTYALLPNCLCTRGDTLVVYLRNNPRLYGIFSDDSWGAFPYVYCNFGEDSVVWGNFSDTSAPTQVQGWGATFRSSVDDWQIFYGYAPSTDNFDYDDDNGMISLDYAATSIALKQINLPITHDGYPVTWIDHISIRGDYSDSVSIHIPASIEGGDDYAITGSITNGKAIRTVQYDNAFGDMHWNIEKPIKHLIVPNFATDTRLTEIFYWEISDSGFLDINSGELTESITILPTYKTALSGGGVNSVYFPKLKYFYAPKNIVEFPYGYFENLTTLVNYPFTNKVWTWNITDDEDNDSTHYFGDNTSSTQSENDAVRIKWLIKQFKEPNNSYSDVIAYTALSKLTFPTLSSSNVGYNGRNYYWAIEITNSNSQAVNLVLSCPKQVTTSDSDGNYGYVYDPFASTSALTKITVPASSTTTVQAVIPVSSGYSRPYILFETSSSAKGYYRVAYPGINVESGSVSYYRYDDN